MDQQDQLEELLVEWGLRRQQGEEISAEELCRNCPELAAELAELITDLKATDWIEQDEDTAVSFLVQSDKSTLVTRGGLSPLPQTDMDLAEFCSRLEDSGLLTQEAISELRHLYPANDAHSFASQLVGDKKLTLFQATVLLQRSDLPLVLDRYVLLDEIGAGGMGAVFKALHQRMDRIVALKILPQEALDSPEKIKRFHREVKAAARLEHPNIVTAFDAHTDKGVHFLVMSYVDGIDLAKLVRQQGPLPPAKAFNYSAQAARGLQHAHSMGIIHRDIKPANLLVDREGNVKILDMGLARIDASTSQSQPAESFELTTAGMVMGTVAYLAPEQAIDTRDADARSDVYSLGCTLYYLLKGRPIFVEDTTYKMLIAHREKESPDLEGDRFTPQINQVFHRMVAKKPDDRYQSMTELLQDLETLEIPESAPEPLADSVSIPTEFVETATAIDTNRDLTKAAHQLAPSIKQPRWPVATFCLLAFFGIVLAAGFLLKVKTPQGTIILEIDQPDLAGAEVLVDDEKRITIQTGQGQEPITVTADQKTHKLKVVKGGFQTFTQDFQVDAAGNQTIHVHLEPLAQEVAANIPQPAMPTPATPETLVAPAASPANEDDPQRRLAESLIRGGGSPLIVTRTGKRNVSKSADIRPARFAVAEINMIDCPKAVDADLAPAAPLYSLESIVVPGTPLTDEAMNSIEHSSAIDTLYLTGTKMTAAGLAKFSQSDNVTAVLAPAAPIKPTDVVGMKRLRRYEGDQAFDSGSVLALAQLKDLRLIAASRNSASGVELAQLAGLTHLRDLRINAGLQEGVAIPALAQLKSLRRIKLDDVFTKEGAARLQATRPDLVVIHKDLPPREDQIQIAQWVLDNGGLFTPWRGGDAGQIPNQSFAIDSIVIDGVKNPNGKEAIHLKGIIGLYSLHWEMKNDADIALETIGTFDSLVQLEMRATDVTAAGMAHVAKLSELEYVDFRYCKSLTDDAVPFLSKLEFVRLLQLRGTPITDAAFPPLSEMHSLRTLDLGNCRGLTGAGLTHLKSLPRLHQLHLEGTSLTDDAIPHLSELKTVRILNIANTQITPAGAAKLQAAMPKCVVLHESLDDIPWRSPNETPSLATQPMSEEKVDKDPQRNLAESVMRGGGRTFVATSGGTRYFDKPADIRPARFAVCEIWMQNRPEGGEAALAAAAPIYSLDYLNFPGTPLSVDAMNVIQHADEIDRLYLSDTKMSAAGISRFAQSDNVTELRTSVPYILPIDVLGMKRLRLFESVPILDAQSVATLAQFRALRRLSGNINDSSAPELAKLAVLPHLRDIRIYDGPSQEEAAITAIAQLKSLRYVQLWKDFTKAGAARLQDLRPDLVVICPELPAREDQRKIAQWTLDNGLSLQVWPMGKVKEAPQKSFAIEAIVIDSTKVSDGKQASHLKGIIGLSSFQWDRSKNADDALETIGTFDSLVQLEMRYSDVTATGMAHVAKLPELEFVDFTNCKSLHDDAVPFLSKLEFVRQLHLRGAPITDASFAPLGEMQGLRILDLGNCKELTGSGLTHLKSLPRLHRLYLEGTSLTDEAIPHLSELKTVRVLNVANTKITPEGASQLQAAMPKCVVLHESLDDIPWQSPDTPQTLATQSAPAEQAEENPQRRLAESIVRCGGYVHVAQADKPNLIVSKLENLPDSRFAIFSVLVNDKPNAVDADLAPLAPLHSVESLTLAATPFTDAALEHVRHRNGITTLRIPYTKVDTAGIAKFSQSDNVTFLEHAGVPIQPQGVAGMKELRYYEGVANLDADSITTLSRLKNLRYVTAQAYKASGAELGQLSTLSHLNSLYIDGGLDEGVAIPELAKLASLRRLGFWDTNITQAGAERLQALLPNAAVVHPQLPPREDQCKIVRWILDQKGEVRTWKWKAISRVPTKSFAVESIRLIGAQEIDGREAENLRGIVGVQEFQWETLKNADVAMKTIGTFDSLVQLHLTYSDLTAAGMSHVAKLPELEYLYLSGSSPAFTDDALAPLAQLQFLKELYLERTFITDGCLRHLGSLGSLRFLTLTGCKNITGSGLEDLASLPRLQRLYLDETGLSDEAIPLLANLKSLRILNIARTKITPEGAAKLQAAMPKCVVLHESLNEIPWRSPDDAEVPATTSESQEDASYSLSFDGADDYVAVENVLLGQDSAAATQGYTVEGWFSIGAQPNSHMTAFDFRTDQIKMSAFTEPAPDSRWRCTGLALPDGQSVIPFGERLTNDKWVHLASVWDGKRFTFYMNGKFGGGNDLSVEPNDAKEIMNFYLGRYSPLDGETFFHGKIREVRISRGKRYAEEFAPEQHLEVDDDTLALYHFDNTAGNLLVDASGNGRHGKIHGATWVDKAGAPVSQDSEFALAFDGQKDYVSLENIPLPQNEETAAKGYTVEGWVTVNALQDMNATAIDFRTNRIKFGIYTDKVPNNYWRSSCCSLPEWKCSIPFGELSVQGKWVHVASVWDGKRFNFYMNGKLRGGSDVSVSPDVADEFMTIHLGSNPAPEERWFFQGNIREIRISRGKRYAEGFTPEAHFQSDDDTLALYRFEQGGGDVLIDSSGHGHDAKIQGAKWIKVENPLQEEAPSEP